MTGRGSDRLLVFLALAATAWRADTCLAQGLTPAQAAARMTLPPGLAVRVVASEPMIRQPVCIEFDDRGRLWVIQYLQYPNPAGLERVTVDRFSRTRYDRRPEPPPRGPRGADRVTILEDDDNDGVADRAHDFVAGLNLASGLAFGNGGVYILQAPYLLFYPDRNRDDQPDGDPEVLLTGFGLEDAHSVANSLTWGPDGWLYGLQGSTVTASIRGIEFQQGVWRYHPRSKRFELHCEGGGNMWGLDYDPRGRMLASTNVGAHVALDVVQGAWCWKSFGKHGALHNPHAYGYFDHVPHSGSSREGHVATGGLFYQAENLPTAFRGRFIAGDLLGHAVRWYDVEPLGSTVKTRLAGDLIVSNDPWFAPCDVTVGPDGAVHVADWHDKRTAHPDPDADWDRSNGRVYSVHSPNEKRPARFDLGTMSDDALFALLEHPNAWFTRRARRILAERANPGLLDRMRRLMREPGKTRPIEALWLLASADGLDSAIAASLLDHPDPDVRAWTVRLIGDGLEPFRHEPALGASAALMPRLVELAKHEPNAVVRSQLAATARRLPPTTAQDIALALLERDVDPDDPHIPLLLWWTLERDAIELATRLRERLAAPSLARGKMVRRMILPRLIRRLVAEGTSASDGEARLLLLQEPTEGELTRRLEAIESGIGERRPNAPPLGSGLPAALVRSWEERPDDPLRLALAARLGHEPARARALAVAADSGRPEADRVASIRPLRDLPTERTRELLLRLATEKGPASVQGAALDALGRLDDPVLARRLVDLHPRMPAPWRERALAVLLSRKGSTSTFLEAVERGRIDAKSVPIEPLRVIATLGSPELDALVRKHWGRITQGTPEEKLAEVRRLNNDLRAGEGNATLGREVFRKHCMPCHRLFDEGQTIGPDLTHANRSDRDFLLVSLVDPSAVVRKEYQTSVVATRDGRVQVGLVSEPDGGRLALVNSTGVRVEIPRADVEEIREGTESLMPGDLYRKLSPDDLRNLFRYLRDGLPGR